jgi:Flp pilus assembly protein protease CpaA
MPADHLTLLYLPSYFHFLAGAAMISAGATTVDSSVAVRRGMSTKQLCWFAAFALPLLAGPLWCFAWSWQSHRLGTLSGFVLLAVLVVSALTDLRDNKIYNWATYTAFVWAVAINFTATLLASGEGTSVLVFQPAEHVGPAMLGGIGLAQCLVGAAVCFAITFVAYDLSGGGAGDVKLAAVIGALLGVHDGILAVAYTYVFAAVGIILWSVYSRGPLALVKAVGRTLGAKLGPLWPFPPAADDSSLLLKPVALGPFFALGTILVLLEVVPT